MTGAPSGEHGARLPWTGLHGQLGVADYHRCADSYEHHGVDLAALPLIGVGSICRRQHTGEVERIVRSLSRHADTVHQIGEDRMITAIRFERGELRWV
jgi:hypothetical protein